MTNIVEQLFKSLDPWPGFQITSFKIQVSPVDGRKTLILDLRPVEGSMPICSRCRHEAPLVHGYVSRRIKERSLLGYFVELNVTLRRVDCLHCKGHPMEKTVHVHENCCSRVLRILSSFIDVIARVARLESDSMIDGTAADFNTTAYSISGEIGHRFDLAPTVFIEPQAEMSWGYVDGKTFSTVNKVTGIAVDTTVDSTTSLIGRLGVRAGITCPNKKGTAYVRTSVLHEFDGDVSVTRGDGTYREDAGDTWFEYAIGGSYNLTGTTQFYADLSRTSNAEIAEPWRFNVGARWAF